MKKRILSLLLLAILAFGILSVSGCTQYAITSDGETFEEGKSGYYSFYVHWQRDYFKELLKNYNLDITTNMDSAYTETETVRQAIVSSAKTQYISFVVVTQKFDELGLTLTEEQISDLEKQYNNEWIKVYGEEGMKNILDTLDLSKDEFMNLLAVQVKSDAILEYYYGENGLIPVTEEEKSKHYDDNYLRFKYVLLSTVDEKDKKLPSDELAAKRKLADEIYVKVKNGASMEDMVKEYSEDYIRDFDKMTADEKKSAEESNAKALKDGIICDLDGVFNYTLYNTYNIAVNKLIISKLATMQVGDSAVVETENSLWVIKKYDIREEASYYEDRKVAIFQSIYMDDFNAKYTRWQADLNYKYSDAVLETLDPGNFTDLFSEVYNLQEGASGSTATN